MLSTAHRRSIHSSLTPILGEEETDALMSQFPASEHDLPASRTDLRIAMKDQEAVMHDLFRRMAMWMVTVIAASLVGGMGLAAAVGAAVGGG
jgi:hypothetical protein